MDPVFEQTRAAWQNFYMLAGTAAATLTGLLFLSMSLRLDVLTSGGANHLLRRAQNSMLNFLFVLSIALVFLIPNISAEVVGGVLLSLAAIGLLRAGRGAVRAVRDKHESDDERKADLGVWRLFAPSLAYLTMGFGAALFIRGSRDGFDWMVGVVIVLLMSASLSAWQLLVRPAEQLRARRVNPDS